MNQLLQPSNVGGGGGENPPGKKMMLNFFLPRKHKSKIEEAHFVPFYSKFHQKILGSVSTKGGQDLF